MKRQMSQISASDPGELALAVSGLSFSYPDKPDVLRDVSLEVLPGERVGLIGPNGAGKTTFFLAICGVLKPKAGEILLFGEPMTPGDFRPPALVLEPQSLSPSVG